MAWLLNAYWFLLLLATAVLGGLASRRPQAGVLAGESVVALAAMQGLWPVLAPAAPPLDLLAHETSVQGVSWRVSFTEPQQALTKLFSLPAGWERVRVYLRIDLSTDYAGDAGFVLEVNGVPLGEINRVTGRMWRVGVGTPHWTYRLPRDVLARAPLVQVTLRPAGLDPRLSIPGHRDPLIEPLGTWNAFFFDGQRWQADRLAGPSGPPASGTYRIWLYFVAGE